MNKFAKIKRYYHNGQWTAAMVRNAVMKGWITALQFTEITGEPYETDGDKP